MDERWGLALSGGVARGIAHIGVLKALREHGMRPGYVAGTSSGSLVAALYAAGVPIERMEALAQEARWRDLVKLTLPRQGLIKLGQIEKVLSKIMDIKDFSGLQLPLGVVACNIANGEKVVLRKGHLAQALQASCAIPGIFRPVRIADQLLVDGGLVENIPVKTCREMGAQHVLAVDVNGFRPLNKEPSSLLEVMIHTVQILASRKAEEEAADADIVLRPDVSELSPTDLEAAEIFMARGYKCASAQL